MFFLENKVGLLRGSDGFSTDDLDEAAAYYSVEDAEEARNNMDHPGKWRVLEAWSVEMSADMALTIAATIIMTFKEDYETVGDCFNALKKSLDKSGFELVIKRRKDLT